LPANLGFPLVREQPAWSRSMAQRLSRLLGAIGS
jgi:hypothetical protein